MKSVTPARGRAKRRDAQAQEREVLKKSFAPAELRDLHRYGASPDGRQARLSPPGRTIRDVLADQIGDTLFAIVWDERRKKR
jgi:hypothetical protein